MPKRRSVSIKTSVYLIEHNFSCYEIENVALASDGSKHLLYANKWVYI